MAKSYSEMTDKEIQAAQAELSKQRRALKDEQRLVAREDYSRQSTRKAQAKVAKLSDPEKDALRQALKPVGIKSDEKVRG